MSLRSYVAAQPLVMAAILMGLALVGAAAVASYTAYAIKASADMVEVTGSAKMSVVADYGRWTINLEAKTGIQNQQLGYDRLETAATKILSYLKEQGFAEVETPAASTVPTYYYPQNSEPVQTGYTVYRSIVVRSNEVDKLVALANDVSPLVGPDYNVTSGGVELTYQKLPETRVALLTDAITDAKARAEAIAKESGRGVGALRSATGGVVQVLPEGGVEVSDYGMYDTQNINKEVMVTVRATFALR